MPAHKGGSDTLTFQRFALWVVAGPDKGAEADFGKDTVQVGASKAADFVLSDPTVSRFHLKIDTDGDRFLLIDVGSTNGTYLGSHRIREAHLTEETTINLGNTTIRFAPLSEAARVQLPTRVRMGPLLGKSRGMRKVYSLIERVAGSSMPVIIEGETGTGKELVARCIHQHSPRGDAPFEVLDCGAVPENLVQSELFGHVRGAFTGAEYNRPGLFERSDGGTVFLDEVGELKLDLQPQLLRVLENNEIRRIGDNKGKPVDVRVVCATHRSLRKLVNQGLFREDLYFRLAGCKIALPPLRERCEDVPLLIEHFLQLYCERSGQDAPVRLSEEMIASLSRRAWPGNVRELFASVHRLCLGLEEAAGSEEGLPEPTASSPNIVPLQQERERFERQYLRNLMARYPQDLNGAAEISGMHPKSLARLLRKYGIDLLGR